jgi:hypothetical protein
MISVKEDGAGKLTSVGMTPPAQAIQQVCFSLDPSHDRCRQMARFIGFLRAKYLDYCAFNLIAGAI